MARPLRIAEFALLSLLPMMSPFVCTASMVSSPSLSSSSSSVTISSSSSLSFSKTQCAADAVAAPTARTRITAFMSAFPTQGYQRLEGLRFSSDASCKINRCPLKSRYHLGKLRAESAMSATEPDVLAEVKARAEKARFTARTTKLLGKPVLPDWKEGVQFVNGDKDCTFTFMEMVVVRGKYARVQMGPNEDGMFAVETMNGEMGSSGVRRLGPTIIGRIVDMSYLDEAFNYYEIS
eukprot:767225-Hanusia_phi.AAC.1